MSFSHHLTPFWNKALGQNLKSNKRFVVEVDGRWPQPHSFQFFIYIFLFLICHRCHFMLSINATDLFLIENGKSRIRIPDLKSGMHCQELLTQTDDARFWFICLSFVPDGADHLAARSPLKVQGIFCWSKKMLFFFFSSIFICQVFDFLLMANFPFSQCCS